MLSHHTAAAAGGIKVGVLEKRREGVQPSGVDDIDRTIVRLNRDHAMTMLLAKQNVAFVRPAGHAFAIMEKAQVVARGGIDALTDQLVHRHMAL